MENDGSRQTTLTQTEAILFVTHDAVSREVTVLPCDLVELRRRPPIPVVPVAKLGVLRQIGLAELGGEDLRAREHVHVMRDIGLALKSAPSLDDREVGIPIWT